MKEIIMPDEKPIEAVADEYADRWPEHAKLTKISAESQVIGEFLDSSSYQLAEWKVINGSDRLVPVNKTIQDVLAEYFGIDQAKIEAEKREMIAALTGGLG